MRGLAIAALITCLVGGGAACGESTGQQDEVPGQRVEVLEVPEVGIAVSLPDGWTAVTVSQDPDLAILTALDPGRLGPDVEVRNVLVAHEPDRPGRDMSLGCTLVSYRPLTHNPDEVMHELYGESTDWPVESLGEGLSRVRAGPGPFTGERFMEQYAIGGDGAIAFLWCSGEDPLESDWLSIAEGVEFLPTE